MTKFEVIPFDIVRYHILPYFRDKNDIKNMLKFKMDQIAVIKHYCGKTYFKNDILSIERSIKYHYKRYDSESYMYPKILNIKGRFLRMKYILEKYKKQYESSLLEFKNGKINYKDFVKDEQSKKLEKYHF